MNNIFKSIKCKSCREKFARQSPWQVACSPDCAEKLVKSKKEKAERKADKAKKDRLKTRSDYIKDAQTVFNAFIRERDKNQPCISCGTPLAQAAVGGGFDCGHYRSVGSAPNMRFNEANAHGQCKQCNRYLSGNAIEYRRGLISRYGVSFVDVVESNQSVQKFTIDDLKAIIAYYKLKLKEIKKWK